MLFAPTVWACFVSFALAPPSLFQNTPPACVENCGNNAVVGTDCGSVSNTTCICINKGFLQSIVACVISDCASADLVAAQSFFGELCASPGSTSASQLSKNTGASASVSVSVTVPVTSTSATALETSSSRTAPYPSNTAPSIPSSTTFPSSAQRLTMSCLALTSIIVGVVRLTL
ncbi:hypothetical protein K488DRAFT_86643 [Vararia minispora EC-137]|uniref:Uncharacterized protein n=1 Tax=Vararia minispora EC-137 TaxID=1314806 RepID=A0ACB8QJ52_9AGAM|nr:hypothetical protein K488DRAFT_86643 [Vararia minispora EC-137]